MRTTDKHQYIINIFFPSGKCYINRGEGKGKYTGKYNRNTEYWVNDTLGVT